MVLHTDSRANTAAVFISGVEIFTDLVMIAPWTLFVAWFHRLRTKIT
jgi:hypothetical protein